MPVAPAARPMHDWPGRRLFAGYLLAQAVTGVALWVAFTGSGPLRRLCELDDAQPTATDAFVLADLLVAVVASALAGRAVLRGSSAAVPLCAFTAGAMVYPTFYLVAWVAIEGTGTACLAIMVPPSILSCWIAWQTWRAFRSVLARRPD